MFEGIWSIIATYLYENEKSVGFRNIAVHEYHAINWYIVYSISTHDLKDFQAFAAEIVAWLENN